MTKKPTRHMTTRLASSLFAALILSACGADFSVKSNLNTTSSSSSSPTSPAPPTPPTPPKAPVNAPGSLLLSNQTVGSTTTAKIISWDVGAEAGPSSPLTGVKAQITILKYTPVDGSPDVYFFTKPSVTAGTIAIHVTGIRLWVNGVEDDVSTTFSAIDTTVNASTTMQLSSATLLHQLTGLASPNDTIALHYDLIWPQGVPLPTGTPAPTADGPTLYVTNCASCHGALSSSTKRGRTFTQIKDSITQVGSMNFLAGTLTDQQLQSIADALK